MKSSRIITNFGLAAILATSMAYSQSKPVHKLNECQIDSIRTVRYVDSLVNASNTIMYRAEEFESACFNNMDPSHIMYTNNVNGANYYAIKALFVQNQAIIQLLKKQKR